MVEADEVTVREAHRRFGERYRPAAFPTRPERSSSPRPSGGVVIHAGDNARIVLGDQISSITVNPILERLREIETDAVVLEPHRAALTRQRELIETEMKSATPESGRVRELVRGAGRVLEKITTAAGTAAAQAAIKHFLGQ